MAKREVDLAGMTPTECPIACDGKCAITGDTCGHPYKSGLQAVHQGRPDAVRNFARAKHFLAVENADKKLSDTL